MAIQDGLTRRGAGAAAASTYVATKQQTVQQQTGRVLGGAVAMTSRPAAKPKGYMGMAPMPGDQGGAPQDEGGGGAPQGQTYTTQAYQDQGGGGQQAQPQEQYAEEAPMTMSMRMPEGADEPAAVPPGFFTRIWNWITGKQATSTFSSERTTVAQAAAMLVERARVGDQNAMAMISLIGANAKKGNEKAKEALIEVERYIRHNPVIKSHKALPLAAQAKVNAQSLFMAEGPPLTDDRIRRMAASFGNERDRHAFADGVNNHENGKIYPHDIPARNIGRTVGYARGLQVISQPGCPISEYSPIVGWELGE
jgi:hypothetical protein